MKEFFKEIYDKFMCRHKWDVITSRKYYGFFGNARGHYKLKNLVGCKICGKIRKMTL